MGKIHVHVRTGHLSRYSDELKAIEPFTDLFDVTHAERVKLENSLYSCYYLKPDKHTVGMFGIAKELLLWYVPYEVLDSRTLRHATEAMQRPSVDGRLERVCFVVVGLADDVGEQIARMHDERTQGALAIPFAVNELKANRDPWFLRTRFSQRLFSRDLFDMEQALVEDSYFFGRESFVFELRDRFRKGENTGLYGLRKSGKTSIIFKLGRLIAAERHEHLVYLDAQTPEIYRLRWWELLTLVRDQIAEHVGIDLPHPLNRPFTERTAVSRFREALSGCLLKGTVQQRVLLVIDEIEHVCPDLSPEGHWNSDFLHFWKLLRSVQTSDRRFAFLIVGVNASASERTSIESQDNPLFSLVGSRYVSPFNRRDTKVMVQTLGRYMGMNVTDDGCEYLEERYGGHPMLIRLACSWEHHRLLAEQAERPVSVSREDLQRREDQRDEDQVQYVKHVIEVLRRWYTEEYDLLTALALGDGDTFQEYARTLPESVQHLRAYGLLREPGPTISIAMIQRYLIATCAGALVKARTGELPEAAVGSAAWLDLVQDLGRLRNVLEPKLRRFIRLVLKGQLGAERWIDPVLAVIPKERREKLGGVSRDEILDHKLFLLDLLQIIDANWDRFKHLEGGDAAVRVTKSQFKVLLDYLNVHREDAHAKGIGQAEVAAVMLASQCLDRAISRYFD